MRKAVDLGINFFDTADAYGDGYAETVLGEQLRDLPRDELVIATKVFNHFNPDGSRYPDLSPEHIRERCDIELARLGIDCIDLYLLHRSEALTAYSEIADCLDGLVKAGKIRTYGVSNHNVTELAAQRSFGDYSVLQPPYSLIDPVGERDLLPYCQAEDIGVMIYSPLHKGLLSGKYDGSEQFDDFRANDPDFQGDRFRALCNAVRSLGEIADGYGVTIPQLVYATTLMHPSIQVAIAGIKTTAQIEEVAGAAGVKISRADYYNVREAVGPGAARVTDAGGTRK